MASGQTDARGHYRIRHAARAWDCCRGMRESDPDIYAEVWRERAGTVARWELLRRSEVFPDHHPASPQTIHFVVGNQTSAVLERPEVAGANDAGFGVGTCSVPGLSEEACASGA